MPPSYTDSFWSSHDALQLYTRVYPGPQPLAPTVLCLHGLTRNSGDFEDLAPHLQRRYRVIVPDVRGRGLSARDPNPQNYQPAIYLQDILALLDADPMIGEMLRTAPAATRPCWTSRNALRRSTLFSREY